MGVRTWIESWPVYRQVTGTDPLGRGQGGAVAPLARPGAADGHGRPRRALGLPVLRRRLRAEGVRQGREGRPDRGQPRLADLARPAVPEGQREQAARHGPAAASRRCSTARPTRRNGPSSTSRRAMDMVTAAVPGGPAQGLAGRRPAGQLRSAARSASPASAARRSTTKRTTSSRSSSRRRARSRSRTRPVFDTPPPSPVWGPASGAAAPPTPSRTSPTPTASSSWARTWRRPTRSGFQWVVEAKARGAKVIHVDPRFTRTSALADAYVPMRAGSDIAFLGGVINYILRTTRTSASTSSRTRTRRSRERGLPGHRGPRRPVLRLRRRPRRLRHRHLAVRGLREQRRTRRARRTTQQAKETASGLQHESGGPQLEGAPHEAAHGPDAAAPALRLQILKRHFARYTPEMVERGLRRPAGAVPAGLRGLDGELRPRADDGGRLRGRLDAAQRRRPVHPDVGRSSSCCSATWAGPAAGSWRCAGTRASRARPTSRRCSTSCPATCRCPPRARTRAFEKYLDSFIGDKQKGFWRNADAYFISLMKEYWGDAATEGQRLLLRLPAPADGRPRHLPHRHGHDRRQGQRVLPARAEPGRRLRARQAAAARHGQPRLARRPGPRDDRERDLLEGRARDRDRRDRAGGVPHRGLLLPGRRRTSRRRAPSPRRSGCCSGARRRSSPRATSARSCGSSTTWAAGSRSAVKDSTDERDQPLQDRQLGLRGARRRAQRRLGAAGHQRLRPHHGHGRQRLHGAEERRDDVLRLLDLLRGLRGRRQPGRPAQAAHASRTRPALEWGWAWPYNRRILYNRASADPQGRPWSERKKYVWWDEDARASGPARTCRTSRRPSPRRTSPTGGRRRAGRPARRRPVRHAGGRQGLALRAQRPAGRADADALRAARVAVPQPALRAAGEPDAQGLRPRGQPVEPLPARGAQPGLPVRAHHLAAHRAPHGGRHEPAARLPLGAAAGDVRRGVARARAPSAAWSTSAGRRS